MHPEGLYTVGSNPFAVHSSWIDLEDGNNRLIVSRATTAPLPFVWREDVAAAAGTYNFSLDAADICCNASYSGPNLPSLLTFQYTTDGGATFNNLASCSRRLRGRRRLPDHQRLVRSADCRHPAAADR